MYILLVSEPPTPARPMGGIRRGLHAGVAFTLKSTSSGSEAQGFSVYQFGRGAEAIVSNKIWPKYGFCHDCSLYE